MSSFIVLLVQIEQVLDLLVEALEALDGDYGVLVYLPALVRRQSRQCVETLYLLEVVLILVLQRGQSLEEPGEAPCAVVLIAAQQVLERRIPLVIGHVADVFVNPLVIS